MSQKFRVEEFRKFLERPEKYGFKVIEGPKTTHAEFWHKGIRVLTHATFWPTNDTMVERARASYLGLCHDEPDQAMACHMGGDCLKFILFLRRANHLRDRGDAVEDCIADFTPVINDFAGQWNDEEKKSLRRRFDEINTVLGWPESAGIRKRLESLRDAAK